LIVVPKPLPSSSDVLGRIEEALTAAVAVFARFQSGAIASEDKAGGRGPVTEADRAVDEVLARMLPREDEGWLSEESKDDDRRLGKRRVWAVDPLDGTKEFVQRNGEFTVNIALVDNQRPVLGVVHAPVLERDYLACEGIGAFRSDATAQGRPIRVVKRGPGPVRVVGSRSHRGSSLDAFLSRVGPHELVEVGSSLKMCLVAEGLADVYPRLGPTCEWDTAAGQCVLEQAGGQVLKLDGNPLEYNREDTLNPNFVGFGDADIDWLALVR
jgi:3'(2'), 5'-bisphosphate nucleotidase